MSTSHSPIDIHLGEGLVRFAATYPTLEEAVHEAVQNSLDGLATMIEIRLSLKTRHLAIRDNGDGVTEEKFHKALSTVGKTIKKSSKLGRFGLGLISPIGKCEKFTFTSCPKPKRDEFVEWTFNTKSIQRQKSDMTIPRRNRTDLVFDPKNLGSRSGASVWWRTEVSIFGYNPDQAISAMNMDALAYNLQKKYSIPMKRRNVKIRIRFVDEKGKESSMTVTAATFMGKALPECEFSEAEAGRTIFRMFLTRQGDRLRSKKINITFGEIGDEYRFDFADATRSSTVREMLSPEVLDAFRTGIFEGEILSEKAKLHADRTRFEHSGALVGFCICINQWFDEVGRKYLEDIRTEGRAERYQKLGVRSIDRVMDILRDQGNSHLQRVIQETFRFGTVGPGHKKVKRKDFVGTQPHTSISPRGGGLQERDPSDEGGPRDSDPPKKENPDHIPASVVGPRGQKRKITRSGSKGIQISHEGLGESARLWELDRDEGIIVLNTTHPLWVAIDKKDWMVCALTEQVILQVLTLESMPDKVLYPQQRFFSDKYIDLLVPWILHGGAMPRIGKKKKA